MAGRIGKSWRVTKDNIQDYWQNISSMWSSNKIEKAASIYRIKTIPTGRPEDKHIMFGKYDIQINSAPYREKHYRPLLHVRSAKGLEMGYFIDVVTTEDENLHQTLPARKIPKQNYIIHDVDVQKVHFGVSKVDIYTGDPSKPYQLSFLTSSDALIQRLEDLLDELEDF